MSWTYVLIFLMGICLSGCSTTMCNYVEMSQKPFIQNPATSDLLRGIPDLDQEKITIANNYLIPTISSQVLFEPGNVIIDDGALEYIIENYTEEEQGVRNLKRCLEIIFTKLNLYRLMKPNTDLFKKENVFEIKFPMNIDNKIIDKLIKMSKEQNDNWKKMYM